MNFPPYFRANDPKGLKQIMETMFSIRERKKLEASKMSYIRKARKVLVRLNRVELEALRAGLIQREPTKRELMWRELYTTVASFLFFFGLCYDSEEVEYSLARKMHDGMGVFVLEDPSPAPAGRYLETIREVIFIISALLRLLWDRTQGNRYKRPKHVICAAMPWTILPSLVILWGVCWMFYNASQAPSPALDFEFDGYFNQMEWLFATNQDFVPNFPGHVVDLPRNDYGQLEPTTSGSPVGVFSRSEVQLQAESGQPIPGLQQQQAEMPSSQPDQEDLFEASAQTPHPEQVRNPIPCTAPGCTSELGTQRDLQRHKDTVHGSSKFPCPIIGCKRGDQNPSNRLDNLQRHMRKAHGQGERMPTTALRVTTTRGQKRRADTASAPVYSPESRRRRTEDAQDSMNSTLNHPPASSHAQDEMTRLQEQLAEARRREEIHVARIKALEQEAEAQAVKFEALRKDNEVQDAYIKLLGRKG
ncbi:hypothetical protein BJ166DRAFT_499608 [Pestalotiopsis sp. NC0098]|nr:hypothetical protein BJ166DRAFT_499608 [Pestalotiopsis sp. NC0098]